MRVFKLNIPAIAAIVFAVVILLIGFCLGFIAGYYNPRTSRFGERENPKIAELLRREIRPGNIRFHLRSLTARPHLSGTEGDATVVRYISSFWRDSGLDTVKVVPYKVLLSFPNVSNPNRIEIRDGNGRTLFTTRLVEPNLRPEHNDSSVVPPFNAYSSAGTPQGKLVYVNYGRVEDFENVTEIVNITGCICVARYGKIFRGNKAALAEKFGCSGLILYSDPADFASTGTNEVYPNSWWLPGTGVQRGSLSLTIGDPLTPLYPATESAYRLDPSEAQLPRIPVQPIGYDDARVLMQNMTGPESPPDWKGRLDVPYNIGPGYGNDDLHVRMDVSTTSKLATTYNVIGFIEGRVEPDRYVILGNHHDAWVFGAVDPSSGTAVMLELSRAFGKLLARGWRPRRTIVFCAWGAEEQGLIGSREWVENFGHILGHRAVAYINVDVAVQGNFTLRGNALPLLKDVLYDVAKSTPNPDEEEIRAGRRNVYETWLKRSPETNATGQLTGRPRVGLLGSGSDYDPFITAIGVTSIDLRYSFDESLGLSSYPLYHSAYETAHLFETYIDPSFKFSTALGQIWAELARRLADSILIPFNVSTYAQTIDSQVRSLEQRYGSLLRRNHIDLEPLHQAVQNFTQASADFEDLVSRTSKEDTQAVRRLNDQMMQLERAFIDPPGVLDRRGQRHVLFAPSMNNLYSGSGLPGLVDSLFRIEKVKNDGERRRRWNEVAKQVSILTFFVETAAASLSRPTEFLSDRGIIQQPSGEVFD